MSEKMNTLKDEKIRYDDIEKVVIVKQEKVNKKFEYKFWDIFTNPEAMDAFANPKPDGIMYTFKITFKDHSKMTAWAKSGTEACDKLLDLASTTRGDYSASGSNNSFSKLSSNFGSSTANTNNKSFDLNLNNNSSIKVVGVPKLGRNELPQGVYIIGKDIPPGTYDFQFVWGHGIISLYSAKEFTLGNEKFSQWVGNKESYEMTACVNVKCEEGWYLHVQGNLIVKISKSQKPIIDL